jgi:hypothetical protein
LDQFFEEQQFEAYRQLGEHIGDQLWLDLFREVRGKEGDPWLAETWTPRWTPPEPSTAEAETPLKTSAETQPQESATEDKEKAVGSQPKPK